MGSLILLVIIVFAILFAIAVPTVIADVSRWIPSAKVQSEEEVKEEAD
ncbi:MAG TPA: hypothetical protein VIS48_12465 [Candidatus Kryptonia bacterium]